MDAIRVALDAYRREPWLGTWLAWKLAEANHAVLEKNKRLKCSPCGELSLERVARSVSQQLSIHGIGFRVDGQPRGAPRARARYKGARTVVTGQIQRSEAPYPQNFPTRGVFLVAPFLGDHKTLYGLDIRRVFPDYPDWSAAVGEGMLPSELAWYFGDRQDPRRYIATPAELKRLAELPYFLHPPRIDPI